MRSTILASVIVLAGLCLTGCAAPVGADDGSVAGDAPGGPWSDLFELTYSQATSDEERLALEDGVITAQEYAYFQDRIVECLSGLSVTAHFNGDHDLEYSNPSGVSQDAIRDCNADNGIRVLILRDAIVRNPSHLDGDEIMVSCLERVGVVDASYSAQDFATGVDIDEIATTEGFTGCEADPIGYGKE